MNDQFRQRISLDNDGIPNTVCSICKERYCDHPMKFGPSTNQIMSMTREERFYQVGIEPLAVDRSPRLSEFKPMKSGESSWVNADLLWMAKDLEEQAHNISDEEAYNDTRGDIRPKLRRAGIMLRQAFEEVSACNHPPSPMAHKGRR